MGKLSLHHVPIFGYQPAAVGCVAVEETLKKLAVARTTEHGCLIEIWKMSHWFHEQTLLPVKSVEAMVWCDGRLFSGGLHSDIVEHDLHSGGIKSSDSAMSGGAIWCLAVNKAQMKIAAGTEAGSVMLFDVVDGVRFSKSFVKLEGRITSIAWYDPLNVIVTGGLDNIRVWSVNSGNPLQRIMIPRQQRNKETIVWAVDVLGSGDEMTIVSGDSTGKTNFWIGPPEQYTRCTSLPSHQSDVRRICASPDGKSVYACGVDPVLVRFELSSVGPDVISEQRWVITNKREQHINDVNTLACINDSVISAGLDCKIMINDFSQRKTTAVSVIPQKSLVHIAHEARCILMQYPTRLELWKLADTDESGDKHGVVLNMSSREKLLLKLSTKENLILCSAVSGCGKWVAYGDQRVVRLYRFALDDSESGHNNNLLALVKMSDCPKHPAHCLAFAPNGKYLVCALRDGTLQLVKLKTPQSTVARTRSLARDDYGPIYLMSISSSGGYLAIAELFHGIHIFRLKKLKLVCTLPKRPSQPTAMAFHPTSEQLIIAYSDRKIMEYNISKEDYTYWSKKQNESVNTEWSLRSNIIRQIFYHTHQPEIVFIQDDEQFVMIDKRLTSQQTQHAETKKGKNKRPCIHVTESKYLIHLDFVKENALVAVGRTPADILEALPPPFKRHKFGV